MIRKPEAGTDTQENLTESAAPTADVTDNVLGGASRSDLKQGFIPLPEPVGEEFLPEYIYGQPPGGFVGRAKGWER